MKKTDYTMQEMSMGKNETKIMKRVMHDEIDNANRVNRYTGHFRDEL